MPPKKAGAKPRAAGSQSLFTFGFTVQTPTPAPVNVVDPLATPAARAAPPARSTTPAVTTPVPAKKRDHGGRVLQPLKSVPVPLDDSDFDLSDYEDTLSPTRKKSKTGGKYPKPPPPSADYGAFLPWQSFGGPKVDFAPSKHSVAVTFVEEAEACLHGADQIYVREWFLRSEKSKELDVVMVGLRRLTWKESRCRLMSEWQNTRINRIEPM